MISESEKPKPEAVVLHLRSGATNPLALEAAARFARAMRAEFEGFFVQDDELLSLAGLPFAREISPTGRRSRPLSVERLNREMRARFSAVQRDIERLARAADLTCRFTAVREAPDAALSHASERARILVLGEPLGGESEPRIPAITCCSDSLEGCLVLGARVRRMTGPVVIALDEHSALDSMVQLAEHWTGDAAEEIVLVLLGGALHRKAELLRDLKTVLSGDRSIRVQAVADIRPERAVADISCRARAGLVIARHRGPLAPDDAGVARIVGALECPLLLHRRTSPD